MIRIILFLISITIANIAFAQVAKGMKEPLINPRGIIDIILPAPTANGQSTITRWDASASVAKSTSVKSSKSNHDNKLASNPSDLSIKIYNTKGESISSGWSVTEEAGISILDLTHLSAGNYKIKILKAANEIAQHEVLITSGIIQGRK